MKSLPKVIYIMGPPGAGKGTQAEMLAQKLGYHRFSTGDAFREMARQNTPLGRRVDEIINGKGELMPPEDAAEVVIAAVKKHGRIKPGLIFDGTPRTLKEAEMVDDYFEQDGFGRPLAIYLVVDKEDMIARNSSRRFCLDIEGDFPVVDDKDEEKCAKLGGRVGTREDDMPEKQETRWREFESKTFPVIEKYETEGILHRVDGQKSIEEVHEQVVGVIGRLESEAGGSAGAV